MSTTPSSVTPEPPEFALVSPVSLEIPAQAKRYPELRYMGSKHRLLPWLHSVLESLDFESAADPFCGSGCVSYLLKSMGRRVVASDFLNFPAVLASATIANGNRRIGRADLDTLLVARRSRAPGFVERTFENVFFRVEDLRFIDRVSGNIERLSHEHAKSLARASLIRACLKRQPRGVFTISGDLSRYDDGRRDLALSIEEHFKEQIEVFNAAVFSNGYRNSARKADALKGRTPDVDLVYLDPPYVPRSDDNCYVKRYHFLEGLSCYWTGEEMSVDHGTKVKKIPKRYTPFSYRRTAVEAFDTMFRRFRSKTVVLSYSSNGFPDLEVIETLLKRYKDHVDVHRRPHRYHFGTHAGVGRSTVEEYLIVGR